MSAGVMSAGVVSAVRGVVISMMAVMTAVRRVVVSVTVVASMRRVTRRMVAVMVSAVRRGHHGGHARGSERRMVVSVMAMVAVVAVVPVVFGGVASAASTHFQGNTARPR